ncbi:hypothetical protein ACFQY0_16065 [Haloferula chungangensis]|uniref:DUF3108 domain-containing protein n=1 Tax=Haloferula chungangensis TaxID=1048331 RepID=A0ABW2LB51_9BACT
MKAYFRTRLLSLLGSVLALNHASAELPTIMDGPTMGNFASQEGETFQLRVSNDGLITINPVDKQGEPTAYLRLRFRFSIRETLPNGKLRQLTVDPASLNSDDPATSDFSETVIRGVAGDGATFEMSIALKRDVLTLGGRITAAGNETRFPLSFHYETTLSHFRGRLLQRLDGDKEEFERIVGEDWFELQQLDGKRFKRQLTDICEGTTEKELNGAGIRKVEVQANIVDKNKRMLLYEATGSSTFTFSIRKKVPFTKATASTGPRTRQRTRRVSHASSSRSARSESSGP